MQKKNITKHNDTPLDDCCRQTEIKSKVGQGQVAVYCVVSQKHGSTAWRSPAIYGRLLQTLSIPPRRLLDCPSMTSRYVLDVLQQSWVVPQHLKERYSYVPLQFLSISCRNNRYTSDIHHEPHQLSIYI